VYKLKLSLPNLPKGEKVVLHGLGEFANGHDHTITKAMVDHYNASLATVEEVPDAERDEEGRVPLHLVPPKPILEAFKNVPGVSITGETKVEGGAK
jgi:hypothetical protein